MIVGVWAAPTSLVRDAWIDDLGAVERERWAALVRPDDRARFLLGATLVRAVAGHLLGAAVVLDRTCPDCGRPHGRVRVVGSTLEVSVSHSGDWVLVGASQAGPVGVDVELIKSTVDVASLAPVALHPAERPILAASADAVRAFTTYWARKEALLKATGDGLRASPAEVHVSAPYEPARLLAWHRRPEVTAWLTDLDLDEAHTACVAVIATEPPPVSLHRAEDLLD